MTIKKVFFLIFPAFLLLISLSVKAHSRDLYPGEELRIINKKQTLIKYIQGRDTNKPLIIFIPGDSHLARIAYGYPGGNPTDFLSYWLNKQGYSFLGISYPLDNPVFSQFYPNLTIQEWGQLIADSAATVIREQHLNKHIVILGWSMGGSIESTATAAAKKQGLIVDAFIGLSAAPPLPAVMQINAYATNQLASHNLADRKKLFPLFTQLITEQEKLNGHTIIPQQTYLQEFLGNIPVALSAEGYYLQNNKLIHNPSLTLDDGTVFDFANTPWIATIRDDAKSTAKLSLIDPVGWDFLRAEMVNNHYLANNSLDKLSERKWKQLSKLIQTLPLSLTTTVHGNHFFFVGEKGAESTAKNIDLLLQRVKQIKFQLNALILEKTT